MQLWSQTAIAKLGKKGQKGATGMTTNQKFPYEEQVGVLRLFICREGNRGEKPEAPGHGSREQSRVKRSQDFSHYKHWEALEGSRRSRS